MSAEILAPCGSARALEAALRSGCDAVYLGLSRFSARGKAENFSETELSQAVYECHRRGVKVHLAINTLVRDSEMEDCVRAVRFAAKTGVDALIVQDLGVLSAARELFPELEIHASTQMTVHSESGMKTVTSLGCTRAVLSRELPLDVIKRLSKMGIETEVFVHGALCMSVSGQCYMSAFIGSRSANRGLCAQACRLPASADGSEAFCLSLKDVSLLPYLRELEAAGVSSFKIEGRMKRPEYVAMAVDSCVKALKGEDYDIKALGDVFSRSGFTDGYYHHRLGSEMFGVRTGEDAAAAARVFPSAHELYRRDEKRSTVAVSFKMTAGSPLSLTLTDENGVSVTAFGAEPEAARNKPWDEEFVRSKLLKFGGTLYEVGSFDCEIGEGLALSPAKLGELRREAVEQLDRERVKANTKTHSPACELHKISKTEPSGGREIRIKIRSLSQLQGLDTDDIELIGVPLALSQKAAEIVPADKLSVIMPRFTFDEPSLGAQLEAAKQSGIKNMTGENVGHFTLAKEYGFELHTDFTLNIANSYALEQASRLGAADCVISPELTAAQIGDIKKSVPIGVCAYGRIPLMLTANCPIRQQVGCQNCKGCITDRTKRSMPVRCDKKNGYAEIFNSDILYIADRAAQFAAADFWQLDFLDETPEQINAVIKDCKNALKGLAPKAKPSNVTFGLYSRGVI